jgi:Pentapeptide repeats (8 copies)
MYRGGDIDMRRISYTQTPRAHRIAGCVVATLFAIFALGAALPATASAAQAAACQPGSGPDLAGKTLTSSEISGYTNGLGCADLASANLSGLDLEQLDFTNANLRGANLQNADLTQATLDGANLTGADLAGATLDQASARGTDFSHADMSGVSLIQTDLTGANLDDTSLGGANFGQATFDGTTLTGATGLTPWSLYLLIAAVLVFVVSAWRVLVRARRNGSPGPRTGVALAGCLLLAFGFHLFAGGVIDEFIGQMTGAPIAQACTGPQCAVGVSSGIVGLIAGIVVMMIGGSLRGGRRMVKVRIA